MPDSELPDPAMLYPIPVGRPRQVGSLARDALLQLHKAICIGIAGHRVINPEAPLCVRPPGPWRDPQVGDTVAGDR